MVPVKLFYHIAVHCVQKILFYVICIRRGLAEKIGFEPIYLVLETNALPLNYFS